MARIDNLTNFLNDVASAIKAKRDYESTQKISASDFDTEILSISTSNNQHITITENGTYTPSGNYTGFDEVIVNVDSIPEGIFIQEETPTKTTSEATWFKYMSGTKASTIIPLNAGSGEANSGSTKKWYYGASSMTYFTWQTILNNLTSEQIDKFDSFAYHFVYNYNVNGRGQRINHYIVATNTVYRDNPNWIKIPSGEEYMIIENSSSVQYKTDGLTVLYYYYDMLYIVEPIYMQDGTTIGWASTLPTAPEDGLNIIVDATHKYILYVNKSNTWTKILDTSNADATASNILLGKTAFVNNTKLTGTMPNNGELNYTPSTEAQTIPTGYTSGGTIAAVTMSDEDYNNALELSEQILGGEE